MRWVVIAVAALVLSALVLRFSRTAALLVLGATLVIGAFAWHQQRGIDREEGLIPIAQVGLEDLRLVKPDRSSRELAGRIHNGSAHYTITEMALDITVDDCTGGDCRQVDQTRVFVRTPVPPRDTREIHQRVLFTSLVSPQARYVPHFHVAYVKAR